MQYYLHFFGLRFHVVWPISVAVIGFLFALVALSPAIMYKTYTRPAIAWVGVIFLAPILGTVLYVLLGVNRIRRRAAVLRGQPPSYRSLAKPTRAEPAGDDLLPQGHGQLGALARLM